MNPRTKLACIFLIPWDFILPKIWARHDSPGFVVKRFCREVSVHVVRIVGRHYLAHCCLLAMRVRLAADTPFPVSQVREMDVGLNQGRKKGRCINIYLANANADRMRENRGVPEETGTFSLWQDFKHRLEVFFTIHNVGGLERFMNDIINNAAGWASARHRGNIRNW